MAKVHNRKDIEDRCFAYRDERWRRGAGLSDGISLNQCYIQDIDQLEYSIVNDKIIYVAILEITRIDKNEKYPNPTKPYFDAILKRYEKDFQGRLAVDLGKKLNCDAYIVLFKYNMEKLWVYNLSQKKGFIEFSQENYFKWLKSKHLQKRSESTKVLTKELFD